MAPKRGLGKGLDALLPLEGESASPENPAYSGEAPLPSAPAAGELSIPLDKLRSNPDQPRKRFEETELRELADSIREHGIIEPIIAEADGKGAYTIVAGERRFRAARIAGLSEAPVIVRSYSANERMLITLIENVQRSDLNPIEEAEGYKKLMEFTGLSQDELAARVGKNRSTVANSLRLLKLPEEARQSLEKGELSPGHARSLLSVNGEGARDALYREILEKGLSVREAEKRAAALNGRAKEPGRGEAAGKESPGQEAAAKRPPELTGMEEKLIEKFGTKVAIAGDLDKGSIRIDYYSMEDLDRLYRLILPS
ncbi:MAG: ParB/RepB/Spo0J family partition protein [Treponema sp.]|nr:ParB/RepB/Spo0J family partition protein [Treponema sp.]